MTVKNGSLYSSCGKQKLNSKSSKKAEVIAMNDEMNQVVWTKYFLQGQSNETKYTAIMQDDHERSGVEINVAFGTINVNNGVRNTDGLGLLLEEKREINGKLLSARSTRHISIRSILLIEHCLCVRLLPKCVTKTKLHTVHFVLHCTEMIRTLSDTF